MVTHNAALADIYASRIIKLSDGKIVSDSNPYEAKVEDKEYILKRRKDVHYLLVLLPQLGLLAYL